MNLYRWHIAKLSVCRFFIVCCCFLHILSLILVLAYVIGEAQLGLCVTRQSNNGTNTEQRR